jgi:predicted cupin superfamily sugar epimerase/uncharacterized protein (DUF952 family)
MIWHLIPLSRWRSEPESGYVPGTRDAAGFVHASPDEPTTLAVANALGWQAGEPLVALALDESALSAPVRYEPGHPAPPPGVPAGTLFPHVYGPVERAAVAEVRYLRRDPAGRYTALEARPVTAEALDLLPHPEGGWYRQTWAAGPGYEPPGYPGWRAAATAIYFLLAPGERSRWHAVRSDELWLWHAGGPLALRLGGTGREPAAAPATVTLGPGLADGQRPQQLVPAGQWQAAAPAGPQEVLVTCVVAPGFDFADFTVPPTTARRAAGSRGGLTTPPEADGMAAR